MWQDWRRRLGRGLLVAALAGCAGCRNATPDAPPAANKGVKTATAPAASGPVKLLNVSYDPTRELYKAINDAFIADWATKNAGQQVSLEQSHGGSGKQARAVIDGLEADVVTLALAYDIDALADKAQLLEPNWQTKLPHNSSPYTSTIVFLVRKGNPKGIRDWPDLLKDGVSVITPNPKTSGGARWNYLAAWGYVLNKELGGFAALKDPAAADKVKAAQAKAQEFVTKLYGHVPVLDTGARGATTTFVERGLGDVFLSWENEAYLAVNKLGKDKFEIVTPSVSILAEPPVAVVDKVVDKRGTRAVAEAYLKFLYTPAGQKIIAANYYRPQDEAAADPADVARFAKTTLFTVADAFGGWKVAQKEHFADGGIFDKVGNPEAIAKGKAAAEAEAKAKAAKGGDKAAKGASGKAPADKK